MSLFRRCKHEWQAKAVQAYTISEKYIWDPTWTEIGDQTVVYYVCSKCQKDKSRLVSGRWSLKHAKELFPNP